MTTAEGEISTSSKWGATPSGSDEVRFLEGPQNRTSELLRAVRIFCEFMRGFRALHFVGPCVTVFGSARFSESHPFYEMARQCGSGLAGAGFTVMTGGGPGIMLGTPAKGASKPGDVYPQVTEWTSQEILAFEKEALGFYITGHPLDKFDRVLNRITSGTISVLKEKAQPGEIKMGGVVSALKLRNTKKGDRYANFNLEDKTGFIEVITCCTGRF